MLSEDLIAPEKRRPFSRREYDRMIELGLFADERIELLHGVLVEMSPIGVPHSRTVQRLTMLLAPRLVGRADLRPGLPLAASDDSEPEPDLAVVAIDSGMTQHPTTAHLVIEVAETSLRKDEAVKAPLYARAAVPEYWIVNLVDRIVDVYTEPTATGYRNRRRYDRVETISLVAFPDITLSVADFVF